MLRITIWNEYRHELVDDAVRELYPDGIHAALAAGISRRPICPGETEFLGRGVSYCATCDGMLYKGKTVA